jgi:hypothetical protein
MTDTKIHGKLYPLQRGEWLRACRKLTPHSHRDMRYYITTIYPYDQGIDINAGKIARQLSIPRHFAHARLALAQATVSEFGIVVTFGEVQ